MDSAKICSHESGTELPLKHEVQNSSVPSECAIGSSGPLLRQIIWTYQRRKLATYQRRKVEKSASVSIFSEKGQLDSFRYQTYQEPENIILQPDNNDFSYRAKVSQICPLMHCRNIVLEQMCDALGENDRSSVSGLVSCIREAILYDPADESRAGGRAIKGRCVSAEDIIRKNFHNAAKDYSMAMSNGTLDDSNHIIYPKWCYRDFFNVLVSEKFSSFCKLLLENFQGIKIGSLFDFTLIKTRMKDRVYERSPNLFSSDIHQVWVNLEKICSDMQSHAKGLLDLSQKSSHGWVLGLAHNNKEAQGLADGQKELRSSESEAEAKRDQMITCGVYKVGNCSQCGESAHGKDCLVCDSCEQMYHFSCIHPSLVRIPARTWFCQKCASNPFTTAHQNCVACDKLNAPPSLPIVPILEPNPISGADADASFEEEFMEEVLCKICKSEVEDMETVVICGYELCSYKYYHARCLTNKELELHCDVWYCPSCLCRVCLKDGDDGLLVLCDGCNHGYHIGCMEPRLDAVPDGKWFCNKCDEGIRRVRDAKRKYGCLLENKVDVG